ncbi:hypothetical protein [Candidatus Venteria ishoeyi]|uniref:Class I SAM-dependent methyltransferase n=1 Tax=Candidatus Venteria ishoeyi TaxID=1899563 RepID=A0A1H6F618_9GAMM|nr:hypothetical protein [Candidatus Venteria ishoeyi]MDM8545651.1 hypothetical protein [Candidatus Venteria ishoeyi]SEH04729.1 Uncharacterised protein [Candidatus Venteria ishoeyi]
MNNVKANFDNLYSQYLPTEYITHVVERLNYTLPFQAMKKFKPYQNALLSDKPLQISVVGSGYGLDIASLKFDITPQEILKRWNNTTTVRQLFSHCLEYEITAVDIEHEPLTFTKDVNLCEKIFVADMSHSYPVPLKQHFNEMTDIVIAMGLTSYVGVEGLERIVQSAFVNGKAKVLYFSIMKYLDIDDFIAVCLDAGLIVKNIGDNILQRHYFNEEEKNNICNILKHKNCFTKKDEEGLRSHLIIAHKPDDVLNNLTDSLN